MSIHTYSLNDDCHVWLTEAGEARLKDHLNVWDEVCGQPVAEYPADELGMRTFALFELITIFGDGVSDPRRYFKHDHVVMGTK
jgi:hypothetical protein